MLRSVGWRGRVWARAVHTSAAVAKCQAGRYKTTPKQERPLTYEMANKPQHIAVRKSWNSWNSSSTTNAVRVSETTVEDVFIRKFVTGTWHRVFLSELIIKRRANMIVIAGVILQSLAPRKIYFLIGYTEEILGYILKCVVKMELQSAPDRKDIVFKYI